MPPVPASTSLCLACSSSLPPRKAEANVYYTSCCSRPICPKCVSTNPRLTRYNPCLRCLAGVNAVNTRSSSGGRHDVGTPKKANVDGSMRDEDIFIVEDEDASESDEDTGEELDEVPERIESPPGAGNTCENVTDTTMNDITPPPDSAGATSGRSYGDSDRHEVVAAPGLPPKYFIRPEDTLLGISLKLGIEARVLCRLNNLPISTLRMTPHLLHTRSFLVLPPSASPPPPLSPAERAADEERRARVARERAETRFQAMTKETDRGVAKAYVALAGLPDGEENEFKEYEKEKGLRKRRIRTSGDADDDGETEERAMDRYFDDEEWEARERAEGRKAALPSFPYMPSAGPSRFTGKAAGEEKSWWRWRG